MSSIVTFLIPIHFMSGIVTFIPIIQLARMTNFAAASNPSRSNASSASTYPLSFASFNASSNDKPVVIFDKM